MPMPNKKSLTERVSERFSEFKEKYSPKLKNAVFDARVRFAYLQESLKGIAQKVNKENIGKLTLISLTAPVVAITYSVPSLASESINVKDYTQPYNFPAIVQMYLKPLDELDQFEKEFIDLLQILPEDKQKDYAKEVYKNQSLTQKLLEKIKQEQIAEKPVTIDDKIDKITQKPKNPVDIYAVIANGTDDKDQRGGPMVAAISFYKLFKDVGVDDDNITLFLYHPNHKDFKDTKKYKKMMEYYKPSLISILLPSDQSKVEIDYENRKVTKTNFLKAISEIPSDSNDLIYIIVSSHGTKDGKIRFPDGYVNTRDIKTSIKSIDKYGRVLILKDTCNAAKSLEQLKGTDNYIAIAACAEDDTAALGEVPLLLVEFFNKYPNISTKKLVDKVPEKNPDRVPVLFYSDKNLIDEPFIPKGYSLK